MRRAPDDRAKVAVLADTDSRWKWGKQVAEALDPQTVIPFMKYGPLAPSERQLRDAGIDPATVITTTIAGFPAALAAADPDVLILALPGDACQAVFHALAAQWSRPQRPVLVTGYVGVVYERVVEGLLNRVGSDVVLANSPHDVERFTTVLRAFDLDPQLVVPTSLAFLAPRGATEGTSLTFATQPGVPSSRADRHYLVERLAAFAATHPERDVVIKVRARAGEQLTHPEPYPYLAMIEKLADRPRNLRVESGPMSQTLAHTGLLVTVSSTAAVEAIHQGIPTAVLTDFGIREELGNTYFIESGCLVSFDDLDAGALPQADPEWARRNGLGEPSTSVFPARIAELRAAELPPVAPFYTLDRSPRYLPWLLAGHGLDAAGMPLRNPRKASRTGGLVSRIAHRLYRQGVGVAAPLLRRFGAS
jgi:hypothetical protein